DPFAFHLFDASCDEILLHFEVGDAITKQTTNAIISLKHRDEVSGSSELLCRSKPGGSRSNNSHLFSGTIGWRLGNNPAFANCPIAGCTFDELDGYGLRI